MKKSSAEDKPTGRLEDVFRQQFDKAEVTPPAGLWDRLEHDLDVADKNTYRKGMLRYRNIAAAALLLLLVTAALLTKNLLHQPDATGTLATKPTLKTEQIINPENQETTYAQNNSGTNVADDTQTNRTSNAIALNPEITPEARTPETEIAYKKNSDNTISEKAKAGIPHNFNTASETAIAARVKENNPKRPIFKPEAFEAGNSSAIALQTKTTGVTTKTTSKAVGEASAARAKKPGKAAEPVTTEPALAMGAKKAQPMVNADPVKANQKPDIEGLTIQKEQLALHETLVAKENQEGSAGNTTKIGLPDKPKQEPENAVIAAKTNDQPSDQENTALALNKTETTEPDTSKQQLQQLAALLENEPSETKKDKPEIKASKWMLLASATPQMFKQNIMLRPAGSNFADMESGMANGQRANFNDAIKEYEDNTSSALFYQFQVGAGYRLRPKWILQTGLGYVQNRAKTESSLSVSAASMTSFNPDQEEVQPVFSAVLFAGLDSTNSSVLSVPGYTANYTYRYVQVPLQLTYEGSRQNWLYQVSGGVAANWLLASETKVGEIKNAKSTGPQATTSTKSEVFNTFLPQALFSAKAGYRLNQTWHLLAGPSVAYGLKNMLRQEKTVINAMSMPSGGNSDLADQKKPYTLGLTMQVSYNLGAKK